jgi:hypothetical protein
MHDRGTPNSLVNRGTVGIAAGLMLPLLIGTFGCQSPPAPLWTSPSNPALGATPNPSDTHTNPPATATPELIRLISPPETAPLPTAPERIDVAVRALCVRVPTKARAAAEPLWNHVREDRLDSGLARRLARNGFRVGVGHARWWDAIQATLAAIEDVKSLETAPARLPANYPLNLELDDGPREQTLFYVGADGVLTGETWPQSRNVLRITQSPNLERRGTIFLTIVPEVRQRLAGWKWVRNEVGLTQQPRFDGRAFPAASFVIDLAPGEFVVIAPSSAADHYGLLGGVFLTQAQDQRRFDSYVFLRADVSHGFDGN